MAIKHNAVYVFTNKLHGGALNVYTSSTPSNGTNVCLYDLDTTDEAQQWRAVYAGVTDSEKVLFWLNTESGGTYSNYALDRYTGSSNLNNADVYRSSASDCSAADQLVYFFKVRTDEYRIILYSNGYYLSANSGTNGNVYWSPTSQADASVWVVEEVIEEGVDVAELGTVTDFNANYYYMASGNSSYPNYVGECVWYCKGRAHEVTGEVCNITGNAKDWAENAENLGYTVSTTPRANSIACFGGGSYGHVVFVEDYVNGVIEYTDTNFYSGTRLSNGQVDIYPIGNDAMLKTKTRTSFENLYPPFLGYIYL